MILGHQILHVLYTDQELNHAEGDAKQFATAFKNKIASTVDDLDLILEFGIAVILNPRQNIIGKFCHIFDPVCGVRWLSMCCVYWDNHDKFAKDVTNQTIIYKEDLVDPAIKSKWPMMAADRAAFAETEIGRRKQS